VYDYADCKVQATTNLCRSDRVYGANIKMVDKVNMMKREKKGKMGAKMTTASEILCFQLSCGTAPPGSITSARNLAPLTQYPFPRGTEHSGSMNVCIVTPISMIIRHYVITTIDI